MSGLTAPPLVLLGSLSRVPSRINSRLSTDLDLSLDPARLRQLARANVSPLAWCPDNRQAERVEELGPHPRPCYPPQDPWQADDPRPFWGYCTRARAHTHTHTHTILSSTQALFRINVTLFPKMEGRGVQVLNIWKYKRGKCKYKYGAKYHNTSSCVLQNLLQTYCVLGPELGLCADRNQMERNATFSALPFNKRRRSQKAFWTHKYF